MEYILIYLIVFLAGMMIGSFLNVCIYRISQKETIVTGRSRCRSCKNMLVELFCGLIYVWIFLVNGFQLTSILFCACTSALIVIGIVDFRTYEIPIGCNIFIGVLGVIRILLDLTHWHDYVIGLFTVSVLFWLIFLLTKGNSMGGGDVKLMAVAGLFLGWKGIILALMIASIAGSVIHISLMVFCGKGKELAFGPYLAAGIFLAMLYGEKIIAWYLGMLGV